MFNQYISGPAKLLQVLSKLEDSEQLNTGMVLVGLDLAESTIKYISIIDDVFEAESIANNITNTPVILIRGIDRQPWNVYDTPSAFDYANKFMSNVNNQVLDVLVADFDNNTYLSDMCSDESCCDPENPTSFEEKKTSIVGIPELVDMLNQ